MQELPGVIEMMPGIDKGMSENVEKTPLESSLRGHVDRTRQRNHECRVSRRSHPLCPLFTRQQLRRPDPRKISGHRTRTL